MTKVRGLKHLLSDTTSTALVQYARQLQALTRLLNQCLSGELADHVLVANLHNETLVLQADSAAWATKLRYLAPQLLRCLQQHEPLASVQRLEFRVAPQSQPATPAASPAQLSSAGADTILASAQTVSDPNLRAALKRLARHRNMGD